ncbi:ABC transporter ATP-binding protein [Ileibacterium valens]|uniref:ABC transporter domain-containing protein n=1 Tax=Ileibacterium valens TaxID=1862668 RepID=A0A1U7NFH8_9FIRM|nr:ABC transporter ATP-binding protein [Ileibacterium valens]OLU39071.1 hypothetical protein BO222_07265 [Ileibacterium valens]OLU41720.1 hypothetical protein BM735_03680 [Erysipelotrichaceae bacterium NYU-BL-F16]OLU41808.1 hypothetical protein BO224_02865 [Erysipelotrichaceae bacterium NYU-BL-E8]
MIETRDLTLGYDGNSVVQDINTKFESGKLTLILGLNGSGKSTLLKTLMGILKPIDGSVLIDGENLENLSIQQRAKKMSAIMQSQKVPSMSVFQYVLHGRFHDLSWPRRYRKKDRLLTLKALKAMGIEELADCRMDEISGGQRQKASLAQALCQDGDIVFLDEPAAYLDAASQFDLYKKAKNLAHKQKKTVIMISHDLPAALENADEVRILHQGKLYFSGTPEEFIQADISSEVFGLEIIEEMIQGKKRYLYLPGENQNQFAGHNEN